MHVCCLALMIWCMRLIWYTASGEDADVVAAGAAAAEDSALAAVCVDL